MAFTEPRTWVVGEIVTAAQMNTHVRDNLDSLGRDVGNVRNIGTAGGAGERWHLAGLPYIDGAALPTASIAAGQLRASPFISPRGGTLDRLAFNVTTGGGAGSVARAGIYQAVSGTDVYPAALLVDGGEFVTTSTGVKVATISLVLIPDLLYWVAFLVGVNAPVVTAIPATIPILGTTSAFGVPAQGAQVAQAYGALPATFPAGATFGFSSVAIAVRYSA